MARSIKVQAAPSLACSLVLDADVLGFAAWFIGGIFVIMSIPISVYEVSWAKLCPRSIPSVGVTLTSPAWSQIAMHTEYYTVPKLQRHVIRILWMVSARSAEERTRCRRWHATCPVVLQVPIYGVDSWFSLGFADARIYLSPIRECYEAYVLYNFFAYLMNFLEDALGGDVEGHLALKPQVEHLIPFRFCFKPWSMGRVYLWQCKKGILNYVILRPLCTILALITDAFGMYGQGRIEFMRSYVYLMLITNCSQVTASRSSSVSVLSVGVVYSACARHSRTNLSCSTPQATVWMHVAGVCNVLLGDAVQCDQGRAGAHPTAVQVHLHQGDHLLLVLAVLPHIAASLDRRDQGQGQRDNVRRKGCGRRPPGLPDLHRDVVCGSGTHLRLPAPGKPCDAVFSRVSKPCGACTQRLSNSALTVAATPAVCIRPADTVGCCTGLHGPESSNQGIFHECALHVRLERRRH
jgi:hypothetical protein